jgi:uncharacterized protein YbjT (DUF2867 family)
VGGIALVTGATGFIGGKLVDGLLESGWSVRCLVRDRGRATDLEQAGVEIVEGDVLDAGSIAGAGEGVEVAYYLVHAMGRGGKADFSERERRAAENFARMAKNEGVGRVIYLGGLGDDPRSEHLRSRQRTAEILAELGPPLTYFRAGMVVGVRSESYRTLRYLVQRLPAMIGPAWLATPTQPIAIDDVISYLSKAPRMPSSEGREIQIGGPDVLSYGEMLDRMAEALGVRRRPRLPVPLLTPWLSSLWIGLVTPVDAAVARPLVEGLSTPTVVTDPSGAADFEISPTPFRLALREALAEDPEIPAAAALLPEPAAEVSRTGAVGSIQEAMVLLPESAGIPNRDFLQRAARAYWRIVNRMTLGLVRVAYGEKHQAVVLVARPLSLLRFHPPTFDIDDDRGEVTWPIERGLLVARDGRGKGFLRLSIERVGDAADEKAPFKVRMEVENFYPSLRGSGRFARLGTLLYGQTQLRIHRWVTRGFLRSLANLDLPPAEPGRIRSEVGAHDSA